MKIWSKLLASAILGIITGYWLGHFVCSLSSDPPEITEWMIGNGYASCISIMDKVYYGDHIEPIAGTDKFIVTRDNGYLILPDKIIVREAK